MTLMIYSQAFLVFHCNQDNLTLEEEDKEGLILMEDLIQTEDLIQMEDLVVVSAEALAVEDSVEDSHEDSL